MNNSFRVEYLQAIRGPVLLVVLGILFALNQNGSVSFGRTWPLILIVLGVIKLFERMAAPPVPAQNAFNAQGPGASGFGRPSYGPARPTQEPYSPQSPVNVPQPLSPSTLPPTPESSEGQRQ